MRTILTSDIEVVVHLAAWLRGLPLAKYLRVNVEATRSLAEISADAPVKRFIYVSSIAVYGPHGDADVDEDAPVKPYGDPYGDSKIAAEHALQTVARERNLDTVIVRPGMVYGPGSPGWTLRIFRLAQRGILPVVDGGQGTAYPIYIDNLIDLLIRCITHPAAPGQVFNAVDDGPVSLRQFFWPYVQMAARHRMVNISGRLATAAAAAFDPFVPGISLRYVANQVQGHGQVLNRKAKVLLGWAPQVALEEGMARSEAWLRREGWL